MLKRKILKTQIFNLFVIIAVLATYLLTIVGQESTENEITVEQVRDKITKKEDIILIDVRTAPEFEGSLGHLPGAILIPFADLESRIEEIEEYKNKEIILYCSSGIRSGRATEILRDKNFKAVNMIGGMLAWNKMNELLIKDSSEVKIDTVSE